MVVVGSRRCTRRHALIAKRNAKFLSSPVKTALYIVGIVSQNAETKVVKA